jgi:DNA-binding beta-propeller fold protein YncE
MTINDIEDPIAIAIDSDNYLYVLNDNTYTVDVYDTATLTTTNYPIVKSISLYNNEDTLRDLFVDSNKNIYVLFEEDEALNEYILRKYDPSGNLLLTLGPFDSPYSIYVDNLSKIYVADRGNDEVIRYDSSGNVLNRFEFSNARAIAVDSSTDFVTERPFIAWNFPRAIDVAKPNLPSAPPLT